MAFLRFKRSDIWYSLLLVSIGTALAGLAATILAFRFIEVQLSLQNGVETTPTGFAMFSIAVPLASALLGPCLWWWAIIKPGHLSVRRGISVGVFGASLAHPLGWYVAMVLAHLTGQATIAGFLVSSPLLDLFGAPILALFSLLWVGWITALVGGLAGGVIALLQSMYGCSDRWHTALSV